MLPAMVIFLSQWFTKRERGRANAYLILGNPVTVLWLSVVSGYLIQATSWRGMFIIEGVPAVIWAFVFRALVADRSSDAHRNPSPLRAPPATSAAPGHSPTWRSTSRSPA